MHNLDAVEVERNLKDARQELVSARERRVKPARDANILTGWNSLMLVAFAEAARVLKRDDYRAIALRNTHFMLTNYVITMVACAARGKRRCADW